MTDATDLAAALLQLEGVAVELDDDSVTVRRDVTTDDRVSLAGVCQAVYEHGGEVRDVRLAPDHERLELDAEVPE